MTYQKYMIEERTPLKQDEEGYKKIQVYSVRWELTSFYGILLAIKGSE